MRLLGRDEEARILAAQEGHPLQLEEALRLVGERMTVTRGDTLEIGVKGFPPARYECVEALLDGSVFWQPATEKLAA